MSIWAGDNAASSEVTKIIAERAPDNSKLLCLFGPVGERALYWWLFPEEPCKCVPSLKTLEAGSGLTPFYFSSLDVSLKKGKKNWLEFISLHVSEHTHTHTILGE